MTDDTTLTPVTPGVTYPQAPTCAAPDEATVASQGTTQDDDLQALPGPFPCPPPGDPDWGQPVYSFTGRYRFLSNFHPTLGTTLEHEFQAAKALNPVDATRIRSAPSPGKAKYWGRSIQLRPDWEDVKDDVMERLVAVKFAPGKALASLLLATGDAHLVEGNTWGDEYWGVNASTGRGRNQLGKILMAQREWLRKHHDHNL